MKRNIKAMQCIAIVILITIIIALIISKFELSVVIICGGLLFFVTVEMLILYFTRKRVFFRKQSIGIIIIMGAFSTTFLVSIIDIVYGAYTMPIVSTLIGVVLLFSGNYIMLAALASYPLHLKEEYEEEIKKEKERAFGLGPYHVVRHPINLASCLIALSLPLILGSVWAFIPAGIVIILTIVHAVISENHRFNKYEWYYEYTKEVPYMMIPVIW